MSLCLEPPNDKAVLGLTRDKIELEVDKQSPSLLREVEGHDRLKQQASRLLSAAKGPDCSLFQLVVLVLSSPRRYKTI